MKTSIVNIQIFLLSKLYLINKHFIQDDITMLEKSNTEKGNTKVGLGTDHGRG